MPPSPRRTKPTRPAGLPGGILFSAVVVGVALAAMSSSDTAVAAFSSSSSFDAGTVVRRTNSASLAVPLGPTSATTTPFEGALNTAAAVRPSRFLSWRSHGCWSCRSRSRRRGGSYAALPFDEDGPVDVPGTTAPPESAEGIYERPDEFDLKTTFALVGGQALLIVAATVAAAILGTPGYGLGAGFNLSADAAKAGSIATIPLFVLAFVLDYAEKSVPALKDVTFATQRSVLALLGGTFRPFVGLGTALALGAAAGVGEEMLFRGVLQSELSSRFGGEWIGLACSSVVFGALHAVTPLYAFLASVASVYFGYMYMSFDNLAVPMVCHGLYDVGALLWAHWTICSMTDEERAEVRDWVSPVEKRAER